MLMISSEQYAALANGIRAQFERELARYLQEKYPEVAAAVFPEDFSIFVQNLCGKATLYGITQENWVASYAELTCQLGIGFPDRPQDVWAREILGAGDVPGNVKPANLQAALKEADVLPDDATMQSDGDMPDQTVSHRT